MADEANETLDATKRPQNPPATGGALLMVDQKGMFFIVPRVIGAVQVR